MLPLPPLHPTLMRRLVGDYQQNRPLKSCRVSTDKNIVPLGGPWGRINEGFLRLPARLRRPVVILRNRLRRWRSGQVTFELLPLTRLLRKTANEQQYIRTLNAWSFYKEQAERLKETQKEHALKENLAASAIEILVKARQSFKDYLIEATISSPKDPPAWVQRMLNMSQYLGQLSQQENKAAADLQTVTTELQEITKQFQQDQIDYEREWAAFVHTGRRYQQALQKRRGVGRWIGFLPKRTHQTSNTGPS